MAPELWTKGHVSQQADVYSFAITLWELATGDRPYKGLNAARILHRVMLNGGRPVLPLWLPPAFSRLVVQCWAQRPKERPSFPEILRRLDTITSGASFHVEVIRLF
ncbi:putative serine/threonine-protein kinase [Tetrabaena socialis]|uniref:Putative serine/threonine-protein kinase n=1 Tax=Tetrabaena socialis TaxID=47790 RepID=A0A2J8AGP5_9CHLO|nr:putative serine/threonine-protein kinase [Tetrabaena socialis]|eukprot:PNH11684.1 putative serine/threonine-protein kinase [Tetrabaena socialis]